MLQKFARGMSTNVCSYYRAKISSKIIKSRKKLHTLCSWWYFYIQIYSLSNLKSSMRVCCQLKINELMRHARARSSCIFINFARSWNNLHFPPRETIMRCDFVMREECVCVCECDVIDKVNNIRYAHIICSAHSIWGERARCLA